MDYTLQITTEFTPTSQYEDAFVMAKLLDEDDPKDIRAKIYLETNKTLKDTTREAIATVLDEWAWEAR